MVDISISTNLGSAFGDDLNTLVWTNVDNVGYAFYIRDTPTQRVVYRKTIDGGVTWGSEVIIDDVLPANNTVSVWYDRWTPNDTGNLIHVITARFTAFNLRYQSLNTDTDILSADVQVLSVGVGTTVSAAIVKTETGNLHIVQVGGNSATLDVNHMRSVDGGSTWAARSIVNAGFARNITWKIKAVPSAQATDDFMVAIHQNNGIMRYNVYDNSGDIWEGVTTFYDTGGTDISNTRFGLSLLQSTNTFVLASWDVGEDLRVFTGTSSGDITEQTQVLTGETLIGEVNVFVEQDSADIYVVYVRQTGGTSSDREVKYKTSTDGGATWSSEQDVSEDAPDVLAQSLDGGIMRVAAQSGRFQPTWRNNTNNTLLTNINNAVIFGASPAPITPAPPLLPSAIPQPGLAGGSMVYIGPDGNVHELVTPHDPGRFVIGFSGAGMPPFDYVTQRSPFQHGDTVKDFFARPRVVQMLIRENFCDRDGWWDGRTTLLDDLRPNRQLTSTGVVTGTLRFVRTDGTIRDLNVFIDEGPRFEPADAGTWDEWSFQEVLRFIAHDPIFFDPTQATLTFAIVLDDDLVFPITYPIEFGSGEVDITSNITYLGSWEEFPIIVITGPLEDVRIDNITTGEFIALDADIASGRTVTIDLRPGFKTVTNDLGANLIGTVSSDSDLATFHIAADPEATDGINVMRLQGKHPTAATSVVINYFTRYVGI